MGKSEIVIKGAKEHNLKNINLSIPRDKLIVFTGLSGSGKSSLAFDTIFADGQRRYMESLSSYARQFLGQMEKPNVDSIEGLSPAISIDQKTTSKNPRSTVGTVTEIYDYLRLLYARIGTPHCPVCGREIKQQTIDQIVEKIMEIEDGSKIQILAPIARGRKGQYKKEFQSVAKSGFVRVRADGVIYDLSEEIELDKNKKHNIEVVVDRLVIGGDIKSRLTDSCETALALAKGIVIIDVIDKEELLFSQNYACPVHGISMEELSPKMFSFNNPYGACEECMGIGYFKKADPDLIVPNGGLTIRQGAIKAPGWSYGDRGTIANMYFDALSKRYKFSLDVPFNKLSKKVKDIIFYGTGDEKVKLVRESEFGRGVYSAVFKGIVNNLERRYKETSSDWAKNEIESYMSDIQCPKCKGLRLKKTALSVTVGGINISGLTSMNINKAYKFLSDLKLNDRNKMIAEPIIKEIKERLNFLKSVGLDYLTLSRDSGSLSGGESQRIRLATQIGSSLVGVLYILDEPSIGLHQRDNDKLIGTLKRLRDLGNTLIVVEHDEDTMRSADWIVDMGPGPGIHGGEVVYNGRVAGLKNCKESITGQYLYGRKSINIPKKIRKGNGKYIEFKGCCENNLKEIDVKLPLGKFIVVTGVSGSGKSSLVNNIIYRYLASKLNRAKIKAGNFKSVEGIEYLDKVIDIDQSPIGRTPRSNPGTYTGLFSDIRQLFATTNGAKMRGHNPGRFSFNVKGGRCEACRGDGIVKIEMHFLPDVYVPCEVCGGKRYNRETLEIKYRGKSIYDVLDMTVEEGLEFFERAPKIKRKLLTLNDVGLGYIKIGQSSTTLSGGEAQRVKLAAELSKRATGKTIYILDEPTTGLHTDDVRELIDVIQKLVDGGNTAVVIEHNLNVIKTADHIIDLGPEGGDQGGYIVAQGAPKSVAECEKSYTGKYLKKILNV